MPSTSHTDDWPQPARILSYFQHMTFILATHRAQIEVSVPSDSPFFGMTTDELDEAFAELRQELEHEVVMLLAASFEAIFQVDFRRRAHSKGPKSNVTKKLRKMWLDNRRAKYIPVELILDVWKKTYPEHRQAIGQLNQLFQFRHWLAHGRYWQQKSGRAVVTPMEAWQSGRELLNRLPGMPPLN